MHKKLLVLSLLFTVHCSFLLAAKNYFTFSQLCTMKREQFFIPKNVQHFNDHRPYYEELLNRKEQELNTKKDNGIWFRKRDLVWGSLEGINSLVISIFSCEFLKEHILRVDEYNQHSLKLALINWDTTKEELLHNIMLSKRVAGSSSIIGTGLCFLIGAVVMYQGIKNIYKGLTYRSQIMNKLRKIEEIRLILLKIAPVVCESD